ncbi:hypothetical protein Vafri_14299 [Volvox africanus]|uniref:Uncharacterized protein n=1 Tax=Volvox africanus TaxID=51714 RepID=A0A8J4F3I0_9CHLO|nr:hypothetical protein Vafri_14299 [Volvox africanus]
MGEVPIREAITLLNNFPVSELTLGMRHEVAMKTIQAEAREWLKECEDDPDRELDDEVLLEYNLEKLKRYFEPQRRHVKTQEFLHMDQANHVPHSGDGTGAVCGGYAWEAAHHHQVHGGSASRDPQRCQDALLQRA